MCPPCTGKGCRFRRLSKSCGDIIWIYFFDNPASVFLAFIAPIFGTISLRLWTYQQSKLEHRWHMQEFRPSDEPVRWQFLRRFGAINRPLSKKINLLYWTFEVPVLTFTSVTTALLISLSVGLDLGTDFVSSRLQTYFMHSKSDFLNENNPYLATGISTFFNAICVCLLSSLYRLWIRWSTEMECHRTRSQLEQSLLMKSCFMEFVNVFLSLFTGILFRALNFGYPGQNTLFLESFEWPVWTGLFGIFYEVYIKCTVIVFVKSAQEWINWDQVKETVQGLAGRRDSGPRNASTPVNSQGQNTSAGYKHCLENFLLLRPGRHPLLHRQFDMCIFIGFAVMFLPASFAWILTLLLLSILTVRGCAIRITRQTRRLSPERAQTIGMWMWLLRGIVAFSIFTNACLIAFASEFVNKVVYQRYYSPDGSMMGYANFSLSYLSVDRFAVSEEDRQLLRGSQVCRYFGYREPPNSANPYALTTVFWVILTAKFIFVSIFILSVVLVNWLLSCVIPPSPRRIAVAKGNERRMIIDLLWHERLKTQS